MSADYDKFKELLEDSHEFPFVYKFKFIGQDDAVEKIAALHPGEKFEYKKSRTGKYTSITLHLKAHSAEHVVETYKEIAKIEGVITL